MKILMVLLLTSCAIKHHVQIGDIERVKGTRLTPFDIKISETGINFKEAAQLTSALTKDGGRAKEIQNMLSLFQMGPRTGNHIFNDKYADVMPTLILKKCPSGRVTGLTMVRETNKYPAVSGEIVRVQGYCVKG